MKELDALEREIRMSGEHLEVSVELALIEVAKAAERRRRAVEEDPDEYMAASRDEYAALDKLKKEISSS